MTKYKSLIIGIIILITISIPVSAMIYFQKQPGKYDQLAQCIADSGAKFYSAFWCPHCQQQKAMFGKSTKHLPMVECSTPDGRGQLEVCSLAGIESYPTWIFADGTKMTGVQSLESLAEQTSCDVNADAVKI